MSAILGEVVRFFKPATELGQTVSEAGSRAGTQFGDVYRSLGRGAATGSTKGPSFWDQLNNYFRIRGGRQPILPRTDYSGGKTAQINPIEDNPAYVDKRIPNPTGFPTKFVAGSGIAGAGIIGGTLVALNPGLQKTLQENAGAIRTLADSFKDITKAGATFSDFLTKNPVIVVIGLGVLALVVLKK